MFPACRTNGEGFTMPTFDLVPSDVEGFMDELWEFQSAFHDCFVRREPRAPFFDAPKRCLRIGSPPVYRKNRLVVQQPPRSPAGFPVGSQ